MKSQFKANVLAILLVSLFLINGLVFLSKTLFKLFNFRVTHSLNNYYTFNLLIKAWRSIKNDFSSLNNFVFFIERQVHNFIDLLIEQPSIEEDNQPEVIEETPKLEIVVVIEKEVINSKLSDYFCFFKYRSLFFELR